MPKAIAMNEVGPSGARFGKLDNVGQTGTLSGVVLSYTLAGAQLVRVTASDDGDGISTLPSPLSSLGKFNDRNDLEPKVTA